MSLPADLIFAATLLPHYAYHRLLSGKYGEAAGEKLGHVASRTNRSPRAWVHAVSVGEALAARPLVRAFTDACPQWEVLVSTTTATGREVAQKHYGRDRVFYYPLDLSWMVRRTWERVRPSLVILMELEVWPNLLEHAVGEKVPVVVANARITARSAARFGLLGAWGRRMLGRVSLWLAQSEEYAGRLHALGVEPERVRVVGSLKHDGVRIGVDPAARKAYRALLGVDDPDLVLVGGSTHPTEELALLETWNGLRARYPRLRRLVLVPRHPHRLGEVEELAARFAPAVRRSAICAQAPAACPVVIVDTMGELGNIYQAADIAFVGGSLIPHGGQNLMEPCGLGVPTLTGPSLHNFAEPAARLLAARGMLQVSAAGEMQAAIARLLREPVAARAMGQRGMQVIQASQGATARSMSLIREILD